MESAHILKELARALFISKGLALASSTLVIYDHAITFAQEVTFFWCGAWSASRILYLSIRYLALTQMLLLLYVNVMPLSFVENRFLIPSYLLAFTVMVLCQSVVTLRVWYLFPRSHLIRWLAAAVFIACTIGTVIASAVESNTIGDVLNSLYSPSTTLIKKTSIFSIYLPSFIVHTVMFSLKIYRFRVSPGALQKHGPIHRLLKEGMFMYAFAAGTLLYEIIGLSTNNVIVYYSALGGEIAVAATVVSVCRAMLSIRSLAAAYDVDPLWLLSHAELSRVHWRRGANEGEIYVGVSEMDVVLPSESVGKTRGEDDV